MSTKQKATRLIQTLQGYDVAEWQRMAIEERNNLLDEYRRAEETIEALAEARKGWM